MMRSLFSGVSGLKSHQTRMDVIGNNIANVNTTGFKAKRLNFADMLYQTTQAGSAANTDTQRGGINPRQIGLGVKTGAINTSITTEGASQSTGNPFDLKLTGEAFFIVSDGTNTYYTRDGSFDVDDAGYLVMANTGYTVMGWTQMDGETLIQSGSVSPINVYQYQTYDAAATTNAYINGIIDKYDDNLLTASGRQVNLQTYDSRGFEYNLKFGIKPVANPGTKTRDVTNMETIYDFTGKQLYAVDNSNKTYSLKYADVGGVVGDTVAWKEGDMPDLDALIEQAVNQAHQAKLGSSDTVYIKFVTSPGADAANPNDDTIEVHIITSATDTGAGTTVGTAILSSGIDSSKLKDAVLTVSLDGHMDYSTSTSTDDVVNVTAETLTALGMQTLPTITTPQNIPNLRITAQTYTDESGNVQTRRRIEAGTPYVDVTDKVDYSALIQLLTIGTESTISQYITTEEIDAGGYIEGQYTISLLGMTDSDGAEVDISNLGDVTYDLVYNTDDGSFSYVGAAGETSFTLGLSRLNTLGNFEDVTVDMSGTKNVDNDKKSTLEGLRADGRKIGTMTGVSIGTDGLVQVQYSNGMARNIAQVAVATFPNAMGLENAGDNLYTQSASSGDVSIVDIAASGTGYMTSGVLEMSNVDLSQEFTEMITTQRGFQANSRTITVSDTLLEELINLKR